MSDEGQKWHRRYDREKKARQQAELLLEKKSSQLYAANSKLEQRFKVEFSKFKREEKKFTALFHSSIDGIILLTVDGEITNANETVCKLLKTDKANLRGSHIFSIHPQGSLEECKQYYSKVNSEGHARFECFIQNSDLTSIPVDISATLSEVDGESIIQAIIRDITSTKKSALDLEMATNAAIKANQAKSLFLATMSHEIRTPLNGIIGFTDLILHGDISREQRQHLKIIKKSGDILINIINDILDFSRIESSQIELEKHDFKITQCIEETLDIHAQTAANKHVELLYFVDPELPIYIHGDSGRLRQILLNLISNGLKFTEEGAVTIRVSMPKKGILQFTVSDTGIGFTEDVREQLFTPFQQADATTTRKYGGTGLGLAICKQLCSAMGGDITSNSVVNEGSNFIITLPLTPAKTKITVENINISDLKGLEVLVVDDHFINLDFMKARLEKWECQVTLASHVNEALKILATSKNPFDLLLSDMLMPDIDGFQLAYEITRNLKCPTPKMILITSSRLERQKKTAIEKGFSQVVYKPVKEYDLARAMLNSLGKIQNPEKKILPLKKNLSQQKLKTFALIVEDNAINAKLAKLLLERLGITAHVAHNGKEAIDSLISKPIYDIILMDMQMPVMDGLDATRRIRNGEAGELYLKIPIVAMTANALIDDEAKCLASGMDNYLTKPIDSQLLEESLRLYDII
tara:strand:+ start:15971 stop:18058 length:2088 start_codon:yes stop_codon:yes gene_type:complete